MNKLQMTQASASTVRSLSQHKGQSELCELLWVLQNLKGGCYLPPPTPYITDSQSLKMRSKEHLASVCVCLTNLLCKYWMTFPQASLPRSQPFWEAGKNTPHEN